ncbi:MAG: hypothetical protein IJV00_06940 [Clostridia bacterium]|nr:hypothetical protein [Clostridia bacterium]
MKKVLQKTILALFCAFIIIYFLVQLIASLGNTITVSQSVLASYEQTDDVTGYILRSEKIITNDIPGIVYTSLEEGARVKKGELVARVYADSAEKNIQERILEIDNRLEILADSQIDTSYITSDVSNLDNTIYSLICRIRADVETNSIGSAVKNRNELLTSLNKRQIIIKSVDDFSDEIRRLKSEKAYLESSLTGELGRVFTPYSGYYSLSLDGWENILTPTLLDTLTVDGFSDILNSEPYIEPDAVGKVFTDFVWYTLCPVDKSVSVDYTVGDYYSIEYYLTSSHTFSVKLDKIISQTDSDTVILVFSSNEIPDGFRYTRKQSVRIIKKRFEGLRVNKEAVRMVDGEQGVYVVLGNTVRFRKTQIIYTSDDYYLVKQSKSTDADYASSLMLYDKVITGGKNLYDGKIID